MSFIWFPLSVAFFNINSSFPLIIGLKRLGKPHKYTTILTTLSRKKQTETKVYTRMAILTWESC